MIFRAIMAYYLQGFIGYGGFSCCDHGDTNFTFCYPPTYGRRHRRYFRHLPSTSEFGCCTAPRYLI